MASKKEIRGKEKKVIGGIISEERGKKRC